VTPRNTTSYSKRASAALALVALVAVAAACGSSKKADDNARSGNAVQKGAASVAGCGKGWTDPADLSSTRAPARCDANTPAAKPLATKTHVVVTSSTWSAEFTSAVVYAKAKGEFDKENLDVELKVVPPADQIQLLGTGQTDAAYTAPDAAFVNSTTTGFDLRWVAGNFSAPAASKTGFWMKTDGGHADVASLKGKTIASAVGTGSVTSYPIAKVLHAAGLKLTDVQFQQLPAVDVLTAIKNGAVPAAWVLDPFWTQLQNQPGYTFVAGQPLGEPLGGLMFGPNLLEKHPEVGQAFVRAYERTINTYFTGDYKANTAFVTELATDLNLKPAQLQATPSQVWDWEIRKDTIVRLQNAYIEGNALKVTAPLPESKLVDRSFTDAAVGHSG
jgi:NitT/TauT family transport system substrate-binding protein